MSNKLPKRWILLGPDLDWVSEARSFLVKLSGERGGHSFLHWRLTYGLLRIAEVKSFNEEISLALRDDVARSALECWTVLSREEWYENAIKCELLIRKENKMLDVNFLDGSTAEQREAALRKFAMYAEEPDIGVEVAWLSSERHLPISRDLLALGPLPEFDIDHNHSMAQEGYRCYSAWASAVLDHNDPAELSAVWGPYSERVDGDAGNGRPISHIRDAREKREQTQMERRSSYRMEGALAAADGSKPERNASNHVWSPIPGFSQGAVRLEAWVRSPKSRDEKLGIEFVALWDDAKKTPLLGLDDIRLVLTLSRRKPVVLSGRLDASPAPGSLYSLRFDWPREAWPEDLREMPSLPLRRELAAVLKKARVSLM